MLWLTGRSLAFLCTLLSLTSIVIFEHTMTNLPTVLSCLAICMDFVYRLMRLFILGLLSFSPLVSLDLVLV